MLLNKLKLMNAQGKSPFRQLTTISLLKELLLERDIENSNKIQMLQLEQSLKAV